MIIDPHEPDATLQRLTATARQKITTARAIELGAGFATVADLEVWIRMLPERRDPDAVPTLLTPTMDPTGIARSAFYLAIAEVVAPEVVRWLGFADDARDRVCVFEVSREEGATSRRVVFDGPPTPPTGDAS